ncbi:MAG: YhcH/YjgK/YiaL family protein [Veillonellales bacterium]
MIYGQLKNLEKEESVFAALIRRGLEFLEKTDIGKLEAGKHIIDGDVMYASVQDYLPKVKTERRAEAHVKYIDIQYVHTGEEYIGCSFLSGQNEVLEDRLAEKDVIFYKNTVDEVPVKLTAGDYAIFLPADIHRPGCSTGSAAQVRKVVVKIKLSAVK